jgi:hypothetical protein
MIVLGGNMGALASAPTSPAHQSSARGDGLRSRLVSYFERANRVWDPDPWAYSEEDSASWREEQMPVLRTGSRFDAPLPELSQPAAGNEEAEECSLTVWRRFHVDGDTIAFTMGRAPESCSEAPRMIWTDSKHRHWRRIIPPLFNWNVEALWCTEHYLIFGLVADFEYGEHDERLAFWHLADGQVVLSPGLAWDDSGRAIQHGASLSERLPGWRDARLAEVGDGLVLTKRDTTLAFWPDRRAYSTASRGGH